MVLVHCDRGYLFSISNVDTGCHLKHHFTVLKKAQHVLAKLLSTDRIAANLKGGSNSFTAALVLRQST